jgi:hypothetical protein
LADWLLLWSAVAVIIWAVASISVAADASPCVRLETFASKRLVSSSSFCARRILASASSAAASSARCLAISASLKTSMARAMAPISSRRAAPSMSTKRSPWASCCVAIASLPIGREMARITVIPRRHMSAMIRAMLNSISLSVHAR